MLTIKSLEYYCGRGWAIFPCVYQKKRPLTEHGYKDASKYWDVVQKWIDKYPQMNVGIATGKVSGITVLDIDPRNGGFESLKNFDIPETPYVDTGGGGRHYYFKYNSKVRGGTNIIAPGMDIKNDGGYVIAPPSIHPNGNPYIWNDEDLELSDTPQWLEKDDFEKEIHSFEWREGPIPKGEQDDKLFRLVCSLKHKRVDPGIIKHTLSDIINDKKKCPQDPNDPFTEKDIERWIKGAFKYPDNEDRSATNPVVLFSPETTEMFKKKDVSEVKYYLEGLMQKRGRTMISAKANMGKSFFLINMLISICSGEEFFLNKFESDQSRPNALYIDFEMGDSAMQERLNMMGDVSTLKNFYIQSIFGWNMMDENYKVALENFIQAKEIEIVAFDPLGSLWFGDENKRESVKGVTDYFDYLLEKYNVSVCLTHHWRKSTRDFKDGGEMAAGSYGWTKWLDNHVTIQGEIDNLLINCDKSRNREKWGQFKVKLNMDNLTFENLGDFQKSNKFTDKDIVGIFNSFGTDKVPLPEFIKKGKHVCSRTTLYRLIEDSKILAVNKTERPHLLYKQEEQIGMEEWE